MKSNRPIFVLSLAVVVLLAWLSAFGGEGDKTQAKGMIMSRAGELLIVSSGGEKTTVVLTDDTKTKDDKGLFGLEKHYMANTVLIPGLKVKVDGVTDEQGRVVAKTITVDGDDLETSEMIQAGLNPTAEQVAANVQTLAEHQQKISANQQGIATNQENIAANRQQIQENIKDIQENTNRFTALAEYDVKDQTTLKFKTGSTAISKRDQAQLKTLADNAKQLKGYLVEVTGFADATGSAAMNTKLSADRAQAVVTYLLQQGGLSALHIVAPGAMGEYGATASNETKAGRAENRRVEVKVLVNKGITGAGS